LPAKQLPLAGFLFLFLDILLIGLVFIYLFYDTYKIISLLANRLSEWFTIHEYLNANDYMCSMNSHNNGLINNDLANNTKSNITKTTIIHDDGSWASSIRSLFVYGTGAMLLQLIRSGSTFGQRAFVMGTTFATDIALKVVTNTINDPDYVKNYYQSWKSIWKDNQTVHIDISKDSVTSQKLSILVDSTSTTSPASLVSTKDTTSKFFPNSNEAEELGRNIINNIFEWLRPIFEPVQVNYSS
jgi:hypothetical protein